MSKIQLYETSIAGIQGVTESRHRPDRRYREIIARTDRKIMENHRKDAETYEKASRFFVV